MRKILILGTSLASVEIVQTAKEMGCYTIVTDNLQPEYSPAKQEADEYWMISTDNLDLLEQKCREEHINAVFAGVSEFNLDRVKELTARLGLPCYIEDSAYKYARDKNAFKNKCREIGLPVVEEYTLSDPPKPEEMVGIEYPVVVKPVDGAGNKGLSICYNDDELLAGCQKARTSSDSGDILIERYVSGEESWNHYYLAEGEIRYAYSCRAFKQPGCPTFLYTCGSSTLSDYEGYKEQLHDKCIALIKEIGCKKGVVWIQFIRDENGRYYALEMAQRMSADTSGKTIKEVTGVNAVEWMLATAFGKDHTADMLPQTAKPPYTTAHFVYFHFAKNSGKISRIQGYDELDRKKYQVSLIVNEGDMVEKNKMMARIVYNVQSSEDMCNGIREIDSKAKILDEKNDNLSIKFTDFEQLSEAHAGLFREVCA